jgi:hypothetical protein
VPRRLGPPNGDPAHGGTIITTHPDEMWGTDATRFYTEQDGWCWFFGAIDHHTDLLRRVQFGWREGWDGYFPARGGGPTAAGLRPEGTTPRGAAR